MKTIAQHTREIFLAGGILLMTAGFFAEPVHSQGNPTMIMSTTFGDIEIEFYPKDAPITVQNFIDYVEAGYFDNLIFHRVIPGFMIQGGGFTADMKPREALAPPIMNEADNGLKNLAGSLSIARTSDPNSGTSQFFINLVDNKFLDHTSKSTSGWGYAVFAQVTKGMDVVQKIATVPTGKVGSHSDVPTTPVVILKAEMTSE